MDKVIAQLSSVGLIIDGYPEIGRLVHCKVDGDKGSKKSGWYVLHEIALDNGKTVIVGRYGNWKLGDEPLRIQFDATLSVEELARAQAEQAKLRERAKAEKQARHEAARTRAETIWPKLPREGVSEYLRRKQVGAFGVRFSRGSIVVPVRDAEGCLRGLQFIDGAGSKKFLTGTPKSGCFHRIGQLVEGCPLAIVEGYATGATIHQVMGWPVAVAFDAGNLAAVAMALRARYPQQRMVICADNDRFTDGNPGVTKAREAARLAGAAVLVPTFDGCGGV